ncbi:chemotaxis protein CheB [Saccharothrix longispora]|uniref:chemotaxis protein CheB n=1 Tax=Saccharothrix longispora TaxID=33920 RepID=UPI0028FDAF5A|nr:chemotaxis protein CheB [Saccharothrix longispora]MDU0292078.1 chemotaxis protein CheB [Saccharothrix longispora]
MPTRDLIVVGASAGGVEALRSFTAGLPADLEAAVAVVLHLPAGGTSALAGILNRSGPLPAVTASHGMALRPGRVHVAPPDHHLIVIDGRIHLSHGPTENGHRPAVDALFRSAAATHGAGVIGVVLSGTLDDGTAGMISIVNRGGLALVQDPEEALFDGMPASVLRNIHVDHVLSAAKMGALLRECVGQEVRQGDEPSDLARRETAIASSGVATHADEVISMGHPSNFSCPDCQGNLVELDVVPKRFRCQVGHAWTAEALLDAQGVTLEKALWTALRTLEEKAGLARRMRQDAVKRGAELLVRRYQRTEEEASSAADVLRGHLLSGEYTRQADAEAGP